MKFSHGDALTAGSANTILDVPSGYDAIVTYLFISNTTGSSKSIDARWVHNSVNIDFLSGKNVGAGDFLEFGGQRVLWSYRTRCRFRSSFYEDKSGEN